MTSDQAAAAGEPPPPINYIYSHLHDSIRAELDTLAAAVLALQQSGASSGGAGLRSELAALQERYRFLEQVYKYHSSVEDEVVYPALDSKVKNVTLAYSVEHEDEEHLFEQLFQLLSRALAAPEGREQLASLRLLACKVEEITTTLRKHLRKEEEQLLPLLLAHFSTAEQAELVAQFLCSIPLSTVEQVISWLKQRTPQEEQAALAAALRQVVADKLLQHLLLAWLSPDGSSSGSGSKACASSDGDGSGKGGGVAVEVVAVAGAPAADAAEPMAVDGCGERQQQGAAPPPTVQLQQQQAAKGGCDDFVCCRAGASGDAHPCGGGKAGGAGAPNGCRYDRDLEEAGITPGSKPPLREIYYFHQAIRSALHSFAAEARALRTAEGRVTTAQLSALVERHRFIRAVCRFHSASEEEIVFPALQRMRGHGGSQQAQQQAAQQQQGQDGGAAERPPSREEEQQAAQAAQQQQQQQQQGPSRDGLRVCQDHDEEGAKLEELGRLLGAVKAHARRGAKEVAALVCQLSDVADSLAKTMHRHMAREEADVLPVLMRSVCMAQQRHMVWRILRAMPLRLLERVMPWVAGRLREEDVQEWLANIRSAAPRHEAPLVELLCQWARRGKLIMPAVDGSGGAGRRRSLDDPSFYSNQTCGPASFLSAMAPREGSGELDRSASGGSPRAVAEAAGGGDGGAWVQPAAGGGEHAAGASQGGGNPHLKRIRTDAAAKAAAMGGGAGALPLSPHGVLLPGLSPRFDHSSYDSTPRLGGSTAGGVNPVDHIFQFHKALRRELREIEATAVAFQVATEEATTWEFDGAIQELEAKFQFLRGIYRAHSKAEDEIVFPALEAKEKLSNVSHAYTLDHKEEEQYFEELAAVLDQVRAAGATRALPALRDHVAQLSRMCAAVRASLETHLRAEEQELWPLFAEHFSTEEQEHLVRRAVLELCSALGSFACEFFAELLSTEEREHLVGVIIGNTGAEVLTTMLSWVQGSLTQEEQEAMIASLKSASRSTAFEQWLGAVRSSGAAAPGGGSAGGSGSGSPKEGEEAGLAAGEGAGNTGASGLAAGAGGGNGGALSHQEELAATLAEVAEYLAQQGIAGRPQPADPSSIAADSSSFKPGWEDIFRMNQKQLEAAIRRVSTDPTLEPQRKAYLRQNIMASHYIVAQQRRMHSSGSSCAATPTALAAAGMRDGLTLAGTPLGQAKPGGSGGGFIAAAVAAAQQAQAAPAGAAPAAPAPAAPTAAQQAAQQAARAAPAIPHYHSSEGGVLGCRHYRRRCMLVAPCCDKPYVCRLCHDEAEDHQVDRYAVSEMVCLECATRQPVAASCSACGASMARYYCSICHLFDDEPGRHIYHCPFCNFCRQGRGLGVDSFHCMSCNACMSLELFNKHRCVEQSLSGNCPVCSDRLFESKHPVKESPCGHFMHSHCFAAYTRYSYTCPVCFKSLGDMSVYWKMIDSLLAAERLPPEYVSRRQAVLCNDCGQTGDAPFHFVYHKCPSCASYNTRVV